MSLNGLETIQKRILDDAEITAQRILEQAALEADAIRADAEARANALQKELSTQAERDGMELVARAKAEAITRRRNLLLESKNRLLDSVFESAYSDIKGFSEDAMCELLTGLLAAAMLEQRDREENDRLLGDTEGTDEIKAYELMLGTRDRERYGKRVLEDTKKKLSAKLPSEMLSKLILAEKPAMIDGGLILRVGNTEMNCSFSLLFSGLRRELEGEVSCALFDARERN